MRWRYYTPHGYNKAIWNLSTYFPYCILYGYNDALWRFENSIFFTNLRSKTNVLSVHNTSNIYSVTLLMIVQFCDIIRPVHLTSDPCSRTEIRNTKLLTTHTVKKYSSSEKVNSLDRTPRPFPTWHSWFFCLGGGLLCLQVVSDHRGFCMPGCVKAGISIFFIEAPIRQEFHFAICDNLIEMTV
jgi:hypothetical protein